MKKVDRCAGCDRVIFGTKPWRVEPGVARVDLLLVSGNFCSICLCRRCKRCPPDLLPRIWAEYVDAYRESVVPTRNRESQQEKELRLFRYDVPLGVLRSVPMGTS